MTSIHSYQNKNVVVLGGATGMGAAVARSAMEQGASTIVLDIAEVPFECDRVIPIDLRSQGSVDEAIAALEGSIDAVFSCAGVADGTPGLPQINFIAQRHFIDSLVEQSKVAQGGGIVMVSSVAGSRWLKDLELTGQLVQSADWEAAEAFIAGHDGSDDYRFSKQAINFYVAARALPFIRQGIRINAVCPGPTDTPLAQANKDQWLGFGADYREAAEVAVLQPQEIANAMLFLGGPGASGVSGTTMVIDRGHIGASVTDAFDSPRVKMIVGVVDPPA